MSQLPPPNPRGNTQTVRTIYFFKSLFLVSIQPNFFGTLDFIGTFSYFLIYFVFQLPPEPPRGNKQTVRTIYFFKSLFLVSIQPNFFGTLDFIGTFSYFLIYFVFQLPPEPPRGNKQTVRTIYFFKSLFLFSIQSNFLGTLDFIRTFS